MMELRERGIYKLPDGDELVASIARGGSFVLYNPRIWERYGVPDFEVDAQGRLTQMGESTRYRIEDLQDTGRTAN
jgi:hypothetical protein